MARRPDQFQDEIGLLQEIYLNSKLFIEEALLEEYPVDFLIIDVVHGFKIFLRIELGSTHLKEERENVGEILRTIVPPLGMLVMTGAVTIISRRNPLCFLSMEEPVF